MSVYWSSRDGSLAPSDATFHLLPFNGNLRSVPLKQVPLPSPKKTRVLKREFSFGKEAWMQAVKQALELIEAGEIEKVVLARACRLELDEAPDPFAVTAALKEVAEGAFIFCSQWEDKAFLGASPERLFAREGRLVWSEAVAGTRHRTLCPHEDARLREELLNSSKDLSEFIPVQRYLETSLTPLCQNKIQFSKTCIHKTANVQHLYSQCSAALRDGITDETILFALHPTPALCGVPKENARKLIQKLEPFDRGLYGGIIGWSSPDRSEWTVGIRSCFLEGKVATLYSGTGIVKGSDGEKEWEELNHKIKLYDAIFFD